MNIPGFTAAASLYRASGRIRRPRPERAAPERTAIIPQLGGKGFKGLTGCISDCRDQHPEKTGEQCRRACSDPFGGVDLSTPGNPLNDFLSSAGIDFWEAACSVNPGSPPGACRWVANQMRRS
jgi:hypothetical protein